jgi:diguanylate cyclase
MLSYKKVIVFPLILASLLLAAAMMWVFFAVYQLIGLTEQKDLVDIQRYELLQLNSAILDAENGERGYLITNNVTFLESYDTGKIASDKYFAQLNKSNQNFPEVTSRIAKAKALVDSKFNLMNKSIQVQLRSGAYASHLHLDKDNSKAIMAEIKAVLTQVDNMLYERRQAYQRDIGYKIKTAISGGTTLVLLTFGLLLFVFKRKSFLFEKILEGQGELDHLSYQAAHDMLTGLANRRGFDSRLKSIHAKSRRASTPYAVFYLDLDGFKQVNDVYGHKMGDKILMHVAKSFKHTLREYDFLARLGGDEFALIVESFEDKLELSKLASRLISALDSPMLVDAKQIKLGVSIGIAVYPKDAREVTALIHMADKAMYQAKQAGRNRFIFHQA